MDTPFERRMVVDNVRLKKRSGTRGDSPAIVVGYAALFYDGTPDTEYKLWDGTVERIMPGAFDQALREDDTVALFNHNGDNILARLSAGTLRLSTDSRGLRYEIDIADTSVGKLVEESIRRRDLKGSSFAFLLRKGGEKFKTEGKKTIRELLALQLFDVGPVTWPAYEATTAEIGIGGIATNSKGKSNPARTRMTERAALIAMLQTLGSGSDLEVTRKSLFDQLRATI